MPRFKIIALLLVLLAILLSSWVSYDVYDGLAQLEDEYAYLWQARLAVNGDLKIPSPPQAEAFVIPFVIDYQGERFGKYPLGFPVVLSMGERFGVVRLINPLFAGLVVWLTYRLGEKLLNRKAGLLAAGLTTISPLFLTYTGSILSHTWGLVLSLTLAISWLDITDPNYPHQRANVPGWLPMWTAGLSLGVLVLSRPWTAIGVAIPFALHGLMLLWRSPKMVQKRIIGVGMIAILTGSIHFLWQFALTKDPFLNPYMLWWPYDRIGFGEGIGVAEGGHSLQQGWIHTKNSLRMIWSDLWGWGQYSWMLIFIGVWAARRHRRVLLIASVFPSLVFVYYAYWVSGPRYFYEGLYSLTILGAAAIAWIGGWMPGQSIKSAYQARIRRSMLLAGLVLFLTLGTLPYTPTRLQNIKDRYGFSHDALDPFQTPEAQSLPPALIIVHTANWWDYGAYLHLENPYLTSPFIFAWVSPALNPSEAFASYFPNRTIYHYYPERPGEFYRNHLP
jgi:4-amino-4-deoxy-L-arabinose transferase-like glycosyltransferase